MSKTQIPPCPYCADPALLDAPKGRGGLEMPVVPKGERFWRSGPPSLLTARQYGARFVAPVAAEQIDERFAAFTVRLVGVNGGWGFKSPLPPPMFDYQICGSVDSVHAGLTLFSAWVAEGYGVETRAHWWPTHETIINQRLALSAKDPAGRNAELEAARLALSFFELETRGAPKLTTVEVVQAVQRLGDKATLARVAEELKVGERTLHDWRRRQKLTWAQVKDRFMNATVS
jgi:hypothetical protein